MEVIYKIPGNSPSDIEVSGNGEKGLVVLVHKANFDQAHAGMLHKIISAIRYDLDQDAVLVQVSNDASIALAQYLPNYKDVISFGVHSEVFGYKIEPKLYEILTIGDKNIMFCDALTSISGNVTKKQHLWNKLQQMFLK
ncbi:MAG: hypothetical protein UZ09_BCD002002412 [Bacteroidetes bacterium OLB9]|nr:MAG: hypothetical protein UZ09_BCD002002412 [Bacteroidetes bacterium OLB9]